MALLNFTTKIVLAVSLVSIGTLSFAADGDHTSWRGTFLGQSRGDVVKALEGKLVTTEDDFAGDPQIQAIGKSHERCGTFDLRNDIVVRMNLNPCFFDIYDNISDRDFAKILLNHYDISSFEPEPTQMSGVSIVYKGNTTHGESLTVFEQIGTISVTVEPEPKGEF
ncbi:hypothetical protein LGH82_02045 [Mesorhizobium sp. PAMC28654]|uniref:hypothetical protein n=1 Tax=Mesorhizobium sp. PAMC28654 TaxID=2880934 RepID=UPI001D0A0C19|nr:hypothetical protein [Mesorhizobium sp. PAMC28654]UDL90201.1 hypothetical protein LGH82_02045 [Mesorhizobium sp. PAMC28654]